MVAERTYRARSPPLPTAASCRLYFVVSLNPPPFVTICQISMGMARLLVAGQGCMPRGPAGAPLLPCTARVSLPCACTHCVFHPAAVMSLSCVNKGWQTGAAASAPAAASSREVQVPDGPVLFLFQ